MREAASGIALGWGILCLTLYSQDVQGMEKDSCEELSKRRDF